MLGVVCDSCVAGHPLTIVEPDRAGAGWAAAPERCRECDDATWRVMAVPGDGSITVLTAAWEAAPEASFPSGSNPFAPDEPKRRPARTGSRTVTGDLRAAPPSPAPGKLPFRASTSRR